MDDGDQLGPVAAALDEGGVVGAKARDIEASRLASVRRMGVRTGRLHEVERDDLVGRRVGELAEHLGLPPGRALEAVGLGVVEPLRADELGLRLGRHRLAREVRGVEHRDRDDEPVGRLAGVVEGTRRLPRVADREHPGCGVDDEAACRLPQLGADAVRLVDDDEDSLAVDALQAFGVVVVGLAADRPAALAEIPAQVGAPRRLPGRPPLAWALRSSRQ
jgi:hypothetical protein